MRFLAAALAATLLFVAPVSAAPDDAAAERDRVRGERSERSTEIDILTAGHAELTAAVAAVEANLVAAEAHLAEAEAEATAAEQVAEEARTAVAGHEAVVAVREAKLREVAVNAYVMPPEYDVVHVLRGVDANEAAIRQVLLDERAGRDRAAIDRLRDAQEGLERGRAEADRVAEDARLLRETTGSRLEELRHLGALQAMMLDELDLRLEAKLGEAAALADLDAELSLRLAMEEIALAEATAAAARSAQGQPVAPGPRAAVPLVTVRGITVHASVGPQLEAMLAAAAADGIGLSGTGYRDPGRQIELRRAHCGDTEFAIYQMSPSQCAPPTARPGTSNHERGLAIDFRYQGAAITSRSSPGFVWLAANGARYGFSNLPSEPWHWSVDGR
jgi:hypothetical protein